MSDKIEKNGKTGAAEKKLKKETFIIVFYIAIIVFLIAVLFLIPSARDALTNDHTLYYGSIDVSDELTCYFVRNEHVYFANATGSVGYYVTEGTSVRKGKLILDIFKDSTVKNTADLSVFKEKASRFMSGDNLFVENETLLQNQADELNRELAETSDENKKYDLNRHISQINSAISNLGVLGGISNGETPAYQMGIVPESYVTDYRGTISYYLDGYEYALNPDTMNLLDKSKLEEETFETVNVCSGAAESGDPLFKVIDNDEWYAAAWIDPEDAGKYQVGTSITVSLPKGDVKGEIYSLDENESGIMLIMRFDTYYEEFCSLRKEDAKVTTSSSEGLLVPNDCITSSGSAVGVYVKDVTGDYEFTPVKVLASDGENSVLVSGFYTESINTNETKKIDTVNVYDQVKTHVKK